MKAKNWIQKRQNFILSGLFLLVLAIFLSIRFDYYYDLNDDVLMKDILAGNYTGVPEGHNIQMLWIISGIISLFYRIVRVLPWYGLFLWICQFGAMFLIMKRSLDCCRRIRSKISVGIVEIVIFAALLMEHLVAVQYTITCTMLAAAAAFLFLTTPGGLTEKQFIKANIPAVLLVILAFLIRSEMLLLVLPMICVAGVIKWSFEDKIFTKTNFIKYLVVFGAILLGLGIGQITHMLAYSSKEWKAFDELFNQRTELYDYQKPPEYGSNREFYESIGITESEQKLFENYNFGIDEEIDETIMGQVATYAASLNKEEKPFWPKLKEKFGLYRYRFLHGAGAVGSDYPWNYITIFLYFTVFLLIFGQAWNDKQEPEKSIYKSRVGAFFGILWRLIFVFAVRSALWLFILMGERDPVRITHSLYFMELVVLGGILFMTVRRREMGERGKLVCLTMLVCVGVFSLLLLPEKIGLVTSDQRSREQTNAPYLALYEYFDEHPDCFYFIDVYSSVSYSEKMFAQVDNSLDNYDIMGGWANKSPLYRKKLQKFGITTMEEGLLTMENVYFVRKDSEDMSWLSLYYEDHGVTIHKKLIKEIDGFEVYEIRRVP